MDFLCCRYFVVYFADCTLGLTLAILFHKLVTGTAQHCSNRRALQDNSTEDVKEHQSFNVWWEALVEIGNYGDPPSYRRWGIQVVFWVLCVVTARLIVGVVVISTIPQLRLFTSALDAHFSGNPTLYVFTVTVFIPVFINIGQAYIQDQVLKWRIRKRSKSLEHPMEAAMIHSLQQADIVPSSTRSRHPA